MMARRWLLASASAITALAGMYLAGTYLRSRAAGELAGTFAWAAENYCLGRRERYAILRTGERMGSERGWWREAFNAEYIAIHEKLDKAKKMVGSRKTCDLHVRHYESGIYEGFVQVGMFSFGVQHPDVEDPPPLPSFAYTPKRETRLLPLPMSDECISAAEDARAGKITDERAHSQCDASGPPPDRSTPTLPRPDSPAITQFAHGVSLNRSAHGEAPFRILTKPGLNYFFKLMRTNTGEMELAGFIVGGTPLETKVREGTFELRYAAGQTWMSDQEFFGPDTAFAKADSPLNFSVGGDRARGVEVQLILHRGGNLKTSPMKRTGF